MCINEAVQVYFRREKLTLVLYSITDVVNSLNSSPAWLELFFTANRYSSRLILKTTKKVTHLKLCIWTYREEHTHLLSQSKMFCSHWITKSSWSSWRAFWIKHKTNSKKLDVCLNFITRSTHTKLVCYKNKYNISTICGCCCTLLEGILEGLVFDHFVEYNWVFLSSEDMTMRCYNKVHKLKL